MKTGVTEKKEEFHSYTTPTYVPGHKSLISKKTLSDKHNPQSLPTRPNSNLSNTQSTVTKPKPTPPSRTLHSSNPWSKPSKKPVAKEEDVNSKYVILKKK